MKGASVSAKDVSGLRGQLAVSRDKAQGEVHPDTTKGEMAYGGAPLAMTGKAAAGDAEAAAAGPKLTDAEFKQANFTSLNAAEKAREAIEPLLDTIDSRIAEFRQRGGRG